MEMKKGLDALKEMLEMLKAWKHDISIGVFCVGSFLTDHPDAVEDDVEANVEDKQ